jgi:phosphoribosylformylglycinamidine synthase
MGERTPLAVLDAPASGRMAIGEALTNIAAADIANSARSSCRPTGWRRRRCRARMRACSTPSKAVSDLCQQIGVSIPVGKDSLSMRTAWEDGGEKKQVVSPLSLIVTAFAAVAGRAQDADAATAAARCGETELLLIDLGRQEPPRRLGAGAGVQRHRQRCAGCR